MKYFASLILSALIVKGYAKAPEIVAGPPMDLLTALVEINTGTDNPDGLARARTVLKPQFEKLGFSAREFQVSPGHTVLSLEIPDSHPRFAILGHLDTVFKVGSEPSRLSIDQNRIYGPGVIDMKGGIVLALDALRALTSPAALRQFRIIINDDEEIGSPFSRAKLLELTDDLEGVLVFEPGTADGSAVTSQSGVRWLELSAKGQAAHAGLEPEKGVNACLELSQKLTAIAALTDFNHNLSVNIGTIEGGTKPNIVCDSAKAHLDVRFRDLRQYQELTKGIESILSRPIATSPATGASAATSIQEIIGLDPVPAGATDALFTIFQQAATDLKMRIGGRHVGYASDANHLASHGRKVLVGLGPYGGGMHSAAEYMDIKGYDARLKLTTRFFQKLTSKGD